MYVVFLSHLCSLILVEGIYLEWVEKYKDSPNEYVQLIIYYDITIASLPTYMYMYTCRLSEHHLLNPNYDKNFKVITNQSDACFGMRYGILGTGQSNIRLG